MRPSAASSGHPWGGIFRTIAATAKIAVEQAAARGVDCRLRVVQGRVVDEVLAATDGADLLIVGATGHARASAAVIGDTARALAERARSPVLLLAAGASLVERVIAVIDESPAAERSRSPVVSRARPGR